MTATVTATETSIIPQADDLAALTMLLCDATAGDDDALAGATALLLSIGWDADAVADLRANVQDVRAQAARLHAAGFHAAVDDLLTGPRVRTDRGILVGPGKRGEAVVVQWSRHGWGYLLPGCDKDTGRAWQYTVNAKGHPGTRDAYRVVPLWFGLMDNYAPLVSH